MRLHPVAVLTFLVLVSACRKVPPPASVVEAPLHSVEPPAADPVDVRPKGPAEAPPPAEPAAAPAVAPPPLVLTHERARNPFAGARFYVNPQYRDDAMSTLANAPPEMLTAINKVARMPTAVWMARIAAIGGDKGRPSLREHLDEALRQQQTSPDPITIVFVLYNLPDRDCAARVSAGELKLSEDGMRRYRQDFIDPIVAILGEPKYRQLRSVAILEPDSLPNLVTNLESHESCRKAAPAYRSGIAYAIQQLASIPNVYVYLDIAHSGWLGWERPAQAAALYREVLQVAGGEALIQGFATNTSNYTPAQEAFDPATAPPGQFDKLIQTFYSWNRIVDEHAYVDALRKEFPDHGFLVDTSRNGWGSRADQVPLDGRHHRGNWCNIRGAGIGPRPQADPREGIDAYFWIKPPGESDGASHPDLAKPGQPYDPRCSPEEAPPTDALPDAPVAGDWFAEGFVELVRNANPPL